MSTLKRKSCQSNPQLVCDKEVLKQVERLSDSVVAEMTASRPPLQPEQAKKMCTQKTKSASSNLLFVCDKEVGIQLKRLSDFVVTEMTAHRPFLQPEESKKMSTQKTKTASSNLWFVCDKEVSIQLERLSDSYVTEMTAHRPFLQPEEAKKMGTSKTKSASSNLSFVCDKEVSIQLERLSDSYVTEMTAHMPFLQPEEIMESHEEPLNINCLPDEMMIKIFSYLLQNELGQIARVCRGWNVLTKSPMLWKKVDMEFSSYHESQTAVAESFVNLLPSCVSRISLKFVFHDDWIESLYFEKLCIKLKTRCPHLEMLILDHARLSDTLPTVIDLCSQHLEKVKILVFKFCEAPYGPVRRKYGGISKIELLDVACCDFGCFSKLPFSRMPNLKWLRLRGSDVNDSWFESDTSFFNQLHMLNLSHTRVSSRTIQAIQNHALNLNELYLCFTHLKDDDLNTNNSVFLHLKTVCLVYCHGVTSNGIVSFIQSCQSLQNVYVTQEVAQSYAVHPYVVVNKYMLRIVKELDFFHTHNFLLK